MKCDNCFIDYTVQWRKGNILKPILCNPCGVYFYRYKKFKIIYEENNIDYYAKILMSFR